MSATEFAFDVTAADFDERVLRKSHELPVLVDFWATWCGPCRMLMPLLAKLAADYRGAFLLAKVETDAEPALAQRFAIRSIPTVKLFRHGQAVEEFMGAQGEHAIRALLDRHIVRESEKAIPSAQAALQAGRADDALVLLDRALATDPGNVRIGVERVRALVALQRFADALQALKDLSPERRSQPDALALSNSIEFARTVATAPAREELERRLAADPQDPETRYQLGVRCIVDGDYETGLAALLELVRRDRKFREEAARKAILGVFTLLGSDHALVRKYRALLASALN